MEVTMDKKEKKSLPEPRTYTVEQIAAMLNIGRTTAYQLVKQEEFRIVRKMCIRDRRRRIYRRSTAGRGDSSR